MMQQRALGGAPDPDEQPEGHLVWRQVAVEGRPAAYGDSGGSKGGAGRSRKGASTSVGVRGEPRLTAVFLHGWALGEHSYKRALKRLARLGCRVLAPALPGFGGTADFPGGGSSFDDYARWCLAFLDAVGVDEPVLLLGHSFGGGVGIATAFERPAAVRRLVLLSSVGAGEWTSEGDSRPQSLRDRSIWEWAIRLPAEVLPLPDLARAVPVLLEDALPNFVHNPWAVWRVANLCRAADLSGELAELRRIGLPVDVVSASEDRVIPARATDALCSSLGVDGAVVSGHHCWMLTDPAAFAAALAPVVDLLLEGGDRFVEDGGGDKRVTARRPA